MTQCKLASYTLKNNILKKVKCLYVGDYPTTFVYYQGDWERTSKPILRKESGILNLFKIPT